MRWEVNFKIFLCSSILIRIYLDFMLFFDFLSFISNMNEICMSFIYERFDKNDYIEIKVKLKINFLGKYFKIM